MDEAREHKHQKNDVYWFRVSPYSNATRDTAKSYVADGGVEAFLNSDY